MLLKNAYRLGKKISEDSIGVLYAGTVAANGISISIREYHHQFCHPSLVEKLQSAILHCADLNHPSVVRIIDSVFTEEGRFFIIYDTPFEGSLAQILQKIKKFPEKQVISLMNEIGKAIEHAHQKRITHGALSPENIDVLGDGRIKVRNFYIDDLLNSFVIAQGRSVLNPAYLSPEQLRGEATKRTTDVLALGVLAYEMLGGAKPYPEITNIAAILKNFHKAPEHLTDRNLEVPKYLDDIVMKAINFYPQYRHQTIVELLGDLRNKKVTVPVEELRRREQEAPPVKTPPAEGWPEAGVVSSKPQSRVVYTPPPRGNILRPQYQHYQRPGGTMPRQPIEPVPVAPIPEVKRIQIKTVTQYVLGGLIAGLVILIVHSLFIGYFDAIPKVEVPNVLGLPMAEAERKFDEVGLRSKLSGYVDDEKVSANCVSSTIPDAGRVVKKNRIVKFFVSKGSEDIAIPDLVERDFSTALTVAQNKGFGVDVKDRVFSNKVIRNQVISQDPAAQTIAKKGTTINVVVSNGYPVTMQIIDKNDQTVTVKLALTVEAAWDAQNVFVYTQDGNGRKKQFEKLLAPGETKEVQIVADKDAVVEVYYFNDLAFKQELKTIEDKDKQR